MTTAEELHVLIAQAQRFAEEEKVLRRALEENIVQAEIRQHLRRELEGIQADVHMRKVDNDWWREKQRLIDQDLMGRHQPDTDNAIVSTVRRGDADEAKDGEVYNCSNAVVKGEYLWRIEGMSWLKNTLKQEDRDYADIESTFKVGSDEFDFRYNPNSGEIGFLKQPDGSTVRQGGTVAVVHLSDEGATFRYRILVKHRAGHFVQWGETGNECHPGFSDVTVHGVAFGPDVWPGKTTNTRNPVTGIFGLSLSELLESEWVSEDAMTLKFELEVRQDIGCELTMLESEARVKIPAETFRSDMLSLLEDGKCSDVTFIVQGERISAHSQILCARSEVFDMQLRSGMRESLSKEIVVEDCEVTTFKALLKFLYSDDFSFIDSIVKAAPRANTDPSTSSGDTGLTQGPVLQKLLSVSHRYQILRLQSWCEDQLCKHITVSDVCTVLCQAHLYEAKQLEKVCLTFIQKHMFAVTVTPMFANLTKDWPAVMLKINMFIAGVSHESAAAAIEAHEHASSSSGGKRKRDD